jgi:hypothetical protein
MEQSLFKELMRTPKMREIYVRRILVLSNSGEVPDSPINQREFRGTDFNDVEALPLIQSQAISNPNSLAFHA